MLGHWSADAITKQPPQLIFCVNDLTRSVAIFETEQPSQIPERLRESALRLLLRLGVPAAQARAEADAMATHRFEPIASRGATDVLGDAKAKFLVMLDDPAFAEFTAIEDFFTSWPGPSATLDPPAKLVRARFELAREGN